MERRGLSNPSKDTNGYHARTTYYNPALNLKAYLGDPSRRSAFAVILLRQVCDTTELAHRIGILLYLTFQTCALTSPPATDQVISTTSSRELSGFLLQVKSPLTTVPFRWFDGSA